MGQIVRRKKKGRPSKTDPPRRNYSTASPLPTDHRRSRRRRNVRYNFDIDDYVDDDEFYDEEDEDVRRRQKKLRLLLCEDESRSNRRVVHAPASSSSDDYDEDDDGKPSKKRKLHRFDGEEEDDNQIEEIIRRKFEEEGDDEEDEEAGGADFDHVTASELPKRVPLPDKKTLELILDKLQKKDIYGVYAEPVDPEELPDYYDVIKHPMDFATVRKKLAKGAYLTLKQFESDVLLICTNAMQYNAPDTIYYKQASSIQEQAKLRFQRLRANADRSEVEVKQEQKTMPNFSVPKKQLRKPVVRTMQDPVDSETFSGAIAPTGDLQNGSCAPTPVRQNSVEGLGADSSSLPGNNLDKGEELLPGKGFVSKLGRKPSMNDENRRATYNISAQPVTESESVFSTFEGESKQFIPVGLHADHAYARSLARFAATLGSVAWKVASQTIEQALPEGVKFGRGWVGEYEPLPTPVLLPQTSKQPNFLPKFQPISNVKKHEKVPKIASPKPNDNSPVFSRIPVKQESPRNKDMKPPFFSSLRVNPSEFSSSNLPHRTEKDGSRQAEPNHRTPVRVGPADFVTRRTQPVSQQGLSDPVHMMKMLQHQKNSNGSVSCPGAQFGPKREDPNNAAQAWMSLGGSGGLAENTNLHKQAQVSRFHFQPVHPFAPQAAKPADLSRFQVQSGWRAVAPQMQPQSRPPDLNIGYQSMGSPVRQSTGMLVDSQQPDLALQL